jgi:large subunit ribosomal protein L23
MNTLYDVIRRPVITEKGLNLKDDHRTLCFEVDSSTSKQEVRQAVERIFKVKVEHVHTLVVPGKFRRRGKFGGYQPSWKKAYVTLAEGERMIEYGEDI